MTLAPWDGIEGIYDFNHAGRRGWVQRKARPLSHRGDYWQVTICGGDGSWREVKLPCKPGRTMESAVRDASDAFPNETTAVITPHHQQYGYFATIS